MSSSPLPVVTYIKPYRAIVGQNSSGSSPASSSGPVLSSTTALQITTLTPDITVEELHYDESIITENPVEQGSVISDHAFNQPSRLELTYGWAGGSPQNTTQDPSFLTSLYAQFLALKQGFVPCKVYTGKRIYQNMVIKSLAVRTDKETENVLSIKISFQEILFATTQLVAIAQPAAQSIPQQTGGTVNQGTVNLNGAPNFDAGALPQ